MGNENSREEKREAKAKKAEAATATTTTSQQSVSQTTMIAPVKAKIAAMIAPVKAKVAAKSAAMEKNSIAEKPAGNLRSSMQMVKQSNQLESTIGNLKVVAEQIQGAAATDRMARELAFATVVNSELTVEFIKKITNVREREVSADYATAIVPVIQAFLDLFKGELSNQRFDDTFIRAMSLVFEPSNSFNQNYFQMNKEMIQAYQPQQEHDYDATRKPYESGGGRDRDRDQERDQGKLDDNIPHKAGGSAATIYCLPRQNNCTSRKCIDLMNYFGSIGGFNLVIQTLAQSFDTSNLNITYVHNLSHIMKKSRAIFHRTYVAEFGESFAESLKCVILATPLEQLKKLTPDQIDEMRAAITEYLGQLEKKEVALQHRLELCKKYLESDALALRRYSIKELNQVISASNVSRKPGIVESLINWMQENDVFNILWDSRKTHVELVKQSKDIFNMLCKKNLMKPELFEAFWNLGTDPTYKSEVFQILMSSNFLQVDHLHMILTKIKETAPEKLRKEEFETLAGNQKFKKELKQPTIDFFWSVLSDQSLYKPDTIISCVANFSAFTKNQTASESKALWAKLAAQLASQENGDSTVALINFFKPMIARVKPEKEEEEGSDISYTDSDSSDEYSDSDDDGDDSDDDIPAHLRQKKGGKEEAKTDKHQLVDMLKSLDDFVEAVVTNLGAYCIKAKVEFESDSLDKEGTYTHEQQIRERFSFLEDFLAASEQKMSKAQFEQVYILFAASPIPSDMELFFTWCAESSQASTLDENQVFAFFSEKIDASELNVQGLPVDGFTFLSDLFIGQNVSNGMLVKYPELSKHKNRKVQKTDQDAAFDVKVDPKQLMNYKMMWEIVRNSQNEKVVSKSIGLLVNCHLNLHEDLNVDDRSTILQSLITQIFEGFAEHQSNSKMIRRLVQLLTAVIQVSEKKGVNVQPHSALLKGETLDNITIRYESIDKRDYWCHPIIDNQFVIKTSTSATMWELKDQVSRILGLHPRYLKLQFSDGTVSQDFMNGMILHQFKLKSGDVIVANRRGMPDFDVEKVPLVQASKHESKAFNHVAHKVIKDLFSEYKDRNLNKMTADQILGYLNRVERKQTFVTDQIFKKLTDKEDDEGNINEGAFVIFYHDKATKKPHHVYKHLKACFIRKDLVKHSEIIEKPSLEASLMPRYTISDNEEQFQQLFHLLGIDDADTSRDVWNLVRMLATNQKIYNQVLAQVSEGEVDWQNVFTDDNLYKQTYKQEIIFDVMEASGQIGVSKVVFVRDIFTLKKNDEGRPAPEIAVQSLQSVQDSIETALKEQWSEKFLSEQGFTYILQNLLNFNIESVVGDNEGAKVVAFQLALIQNNLEQAEKKEQISQEQICTLYRHSYKFLQTVIGKGQDLTLQDKVILENAMVIVNKTTKIVNDLFQEWKDEPNNATSDLMMNGIFNPDPIVRLTFKNGLKNLPLAQASDQDKMLAFDWLFSILADNYFLKNDQRPNSHLFLELLNDLVNMKMSTLYGSDGLAPLTGLMFEHTEGVIDKIVEQISSEHRSKIEKVAPRNEAEENESKERAQARETLLQDLILLMKSLLLESGSAGQQLVQEKDLLSKLFKDFLFSSFYHGLESREEDENQSQVVVLTGSRAGNKTKNITIYQQSRRDTFSLITEILGGSQELMEQFINENMAQLVKRVARPPEWGFKPTSTTGLNQKYVGLVNLQNICYMNSILQQFFMIPAFRYNLLCVEEQPEVRTAKETYVKGEMIKDNMLYQTQRLVANLEASERNIFNMKAFCHSYKEFDGKPTDHSVQKDSQEFLNGFIDRLNDALKPTTRRHLVHDTFGGKQCNQMICPNCGKVKNRIEDFFNLSLGIKGINSIGKALEKMIEGEVINDYKCSGCQKKVDIQKRSMISQTPNVLIVHLQRIAFNMETFNNEKINSYCEFPNILDLKPYSFYEVMGKENRLKTPEQNAQEAEELKNLAGDQSNPDRLEHLEESQEPDGDDCYEFKLVGCNVHHGTADSGHYWSYINTNRQKPDDEVAWRRTEDDPWMEFNDTNVSNFPFNSLAGRCFGNKNNSNQQGTSAYMLFYERVQKKDMKLVVLDNQVSMLQSASVDVQRHGDENQIKMPFMLDMTQNPAVTESFFRLPDMYRAVVQENKNDAFEADSYSREFLGFIPQLLEKVLQNQASLTDATKQASIEIGRKISSEIMARIRQVGSVAGITKAVISILQAQPSLTRQFTAQMLDNSGQRQALIGIFAEYDEDDRSNQKACIQLIKYCLCQTKVQEKDAIFNSESEQIAGPTDRRPKSVFVRFLRFMKQVLHNNASKTPHNAVAFFDMFRDLLVFSGDEILNNAVDHDADSEAFKIGMKAYFEEDTIQTLGHYMLQDKSPLRSMSKVRINGPLDSAPFLSVIMLMMQEDRPECRKDFSSDDNAIISSKEIMETLLAPQEGKDLSSIISLITKGNPKVSKMLAKTHTKNCNQRNVQVLQESLGKMFEFLKIDDDLRRKRIEWVFGFPQLVSRLDYRTKSYMYGLGTIQMISDEIMAFKSEACEGMSDCFLGCLARAKGRDNPSCATMINNISDWCLEDETIARYIFDMPGPCLRFARYSDALVIFAEEIKAETLAKQKRSAGRIPISQKDIDMMAVIDTILEKKDAIEQRFQPWIDEQMEQLSNMSGFEGYVENTALTGECPTLLKSFPPGLVINEAIQEKTQKLQEVKDAQSLCTVTLNQVTCRYAYSTPTGSFNLVCPDQKHKQPGNFQGVDYFKWCEDNEVAPAIQPVEEGTTRFESIARTSTPNLLQILVKPSKPDKTSLIVSIKLSCPTDAKLNVTLPVTALKFSTNGKDEKQAYVFVKIDPTKADWCSGNQFTLQVRCKEKGKSYNGQRR